MRFSLALLAIAVLLIVPIAIGVVVECLSLAPPARSVANDAARNRGIAQPLALSSATQLRAPPSSR